MLISDLKQYLVPSNCGNPNAFMPREDVVIKVHDTLLTGNWLFVRKLEIEKEPGRMADIQFHALDPDEDGWDIDAVVGFAMDGIPDDMDVDVMVYKLCAT